MWAASVLRALGDGTIYVGAIATAVMAIAGLMIAAHKANRRLIRFEAREPIETLGRQLNARMDNITTELDGKLDKRIDTRIEAKLEPVVSQLRHIDRELAEHLAGYQEHR